MAAKKKDILLKGSITIAIDGHSSTGKSTLARQLAEKLQYRYVDSGAMYRAATLHALRTGAIVDGQPDEDRVIEGLKDLEITFHRNRESRINETYLNGECVESEIRDLPVSSHVSAISAIPEVRTILVKLQQRMSGEGGLVMDGRDIGTVVFPDAELKIFMTARPEVRAQRRFEEMKAQGRQVTLEEVMRNVAQRDDMDSSRKDSPLKLADDALLLDNSDLSPDEQFELAMKWVHKRLAERFEKK